MMGLLPPRLKISVLTDISVLGFYGYIGYIGDISVDIFVRPENFQFLVRLQNCNFG